MSIKYEMKKDGLHVTTSALTGAINTVVIAYEKAMATKNAGAALSGAVKSAQSVRQAALTLIHGIQERGLIKPWLGGGKVVQDFLKKMREAEETIGLEFGLDKDDWAELRKPGQYADTRAQAMKAWSFGVPLKVGLDAGGNAILLTTNGLRKINAAHRKAPEEKGVDAYLDALDHYLKENPADYVEAQARLNQIISEARSLLDVAEKQRLAAIENSSAEDEAPEPGQSTPAMVATLDDIDETADPVAAAKLAETA